MENRLFVYGTLMSHFSTAMTSFLKRESTFLGEGYLRGRMYDLGRYPGVVPDPGSPYLVYGNVYELKTPMKALKILDYYEDIPDGVQSTNEYKRAFIPVQIENKEMDCWVYILNRSTEGLEEIKSGNYLKFIETNTRHKQFIDSL